MLENLLINAKKASYELALKSSEKRNTALHNIANALEKNIDKILCANKEDIDSAKENGLKASMIERLTLTESKIKGIIDGVVAVSKLDDYLGVVLDKYERPNGLVIEKISVPFGVIGVIFESRPNVCVDIAALTLKTGNACVLKGGKESIKTNTVLCNIMRDAIKNITDENAISLIETTSREATNELIISKKYVDLLIPRGSKGLINYVVENAKVPYIETGAGNCHLYINEMADIDKSLSVALNAKYQRPSVCNAIESIVVDEKIANEFLPKLYELFNLHNIEMRGCEKAREIIPCNVAINEDFYEEYNDYICSIKVVKDINEAIEHINNHSTHHSEAIMTENADMAKEFMNKIDSACVYHNASTRFTDGGEFGFGAEIGISTQKLHARGPMGLREILSYKYKIYGNGQVRK